MTGTVTRQAPATVNAAPTAVKAPGDHRRRAPHDRVALVHASRVDEVVRAHARGERKVTGAGCRFGVALSAPMDGSGVSTHAAR